MKVISRIIISIFLLCMHCGIAHAEWVRVTSYRFDIYCENGKSHALKALKELVNVDYSMRASLSLPDDVTGMPLTVVVVSRDKDLKEVWPKAHENIAGFYIANANDVFALAIRAAAGHKYYQHASRYVLQHEYGHHFQLQNYSSVYPAWFIEGFAEYFSSVREDKKKLRLGYPSLMRVPTLQNFEWISVEKLLNTHVSKLSTKERPIFYAMSWLATHYFITTVEGREMLAGLMELYQSNSMSEEAFEGVVGVNYGGFQAVLEEYFDGRLNYLKFAAPKLDKSRLKIAKLSRGDAASIEIYFRLAKGELSEVHISETKEDIEKLLVKYPDSKLALQAQILMKLELKEYDSALEAAKTLHQTYPEDFESEYYLGFSYSMLASKMKDLGDDGEAKQSNIFEKAQFHLKRATELEPRDFRAFYRLAQTMYYASENNFDVNSVTYLSQARLLAPQVESVAFNLSVSLVLLKRPDLADGFLKKIANNPHGGMNAAKANSILEIISKGLDKNLAENFLKW